MKASSMQNLDLVDLAVVAFYGLIVVGLGVWAGRRQSSVESYFLAGRNLPWPLVGASILATAFSAASLLGAPGEAFSHGMLWLQLQVGDLLAIGVVIALFVPALRGRRLTTAYEFLEERFDHRLRLAASILFQGQVLLRTGILVYGPALALATLVGMELRWAIVLVGVVAMFYTVLGGITAVVWTDALQLVVIVVGLLLCILRISQGVEGGLAQAWSTAAEAGRLRVVDPSQSWHSVRSVAGAVLGYGLLSLSVAGTNQQPVQRYLTCRSVRDAQLAAFTGWSVGFLVTGLTLTLGVLLFAFYRQSGAALPTDLAPDAVFPHFIAHELPPGVVGLLVAAIFAAAMSSLDSALNSLATASVHDIVGRYRPRALEPQAQLRLARALTLGWGVLAIGAALYVAGQGTLLALAVRYMGYFAGPMLGLFLLALLAPRVSSSAALAGVTLAFTAVLGWELAARQGWVTGLGIWACAGGTLLTMAIALALSWIRPATDRCDQESDA
jgi:solute:Na+ symporter, SSS family